ncbi:MAG: SUMF1/EgtB/PvdO family nonheme iron enzyme [Planctomycetota bacterium]
MSVSTSSQAREKAAQGPALKPDTVSVPGLRVDRTPVTNRRYAAFVVAAGHRAPAFWRKGEMPEGLADHPVVGIDFFDALAFARWAGGVLPTEAEWIAASGLEAHTYYPWGDHFEHQLCNTVRSEIKGTTAIGSYPDGVSPSGCEDLSGNVWELTCSGAPDDDQSILVKGGSWYDFPVHARLDHSFRSRMHKHGATVGFRLIYGREERLPDSVSEALADACIEFRAQSAAPDSGLEETSAEFAMVVDDLRKQASEGVDLAEVAREVTLTDPGHAVDQFFDSVEREPQIGVKGTLTATKLAESAQTAKAERASTGAARIAPISGWLAALRQTAQEKLAAHPRALLIPLAPAALLLIWLIAVSYAEAPPPSALHRPAGREASTQASPRGTGRTSRIPAAGSGMKRLGDTLDRAIQGLESGVMKTRMEAEATLLAHPKRALPKIRAARERTLSEAAGASLRYLELVIEEDSGGRRAVPRLSKRPPTRGLVLVFSKLGRETSDAMGIVRRTAAAEKVRFTAVYHGSARTEAILASFGYALSGARLFIDKDAKFDLEHGVDWPPETLFLDDGGREVFRHPSGISREQLLASLARVAR